jgi:hypothetical protein
MWPLRLSNSEVASIISSSSYLEKLNGYLGFGWHFEKATVPAIRNASEKGKVYSFDGLKTVFLLGGTEAWDPSIDHGEFFVLKGTLGSIFKIIKDYGASIELDSIGTFLPYNSYLIRTALRENSFQLDPWADHGIVFERKI